MLKTKMRKCILSISLLLFLLFLPSSTNSIPSTTTVFIYPSIFSQSTSNTTAWLISPTTSFISDLSFCFWIKLYSHFANRILHYSLNDNQGFRFTLQQNYGFLKLKSVDYLFDYVHPLEPDMWNHFCIVYNATSHEAKIFMNGDLTFSVTEKDILDRDSFRQDLMSKITIGQQKEAFSQPLKGEITLLNIWSSVLTESDISLSAGCSIPETPPDLVDWEKAGWGRGSSVLKTKVKRLALCEGRGEGGVIIVAIRIKMDVAISQCKGLGGVMEVPKNREEVISVFDQFDKVQEKCNNKFFVPIMQINGSWVDSENASSVFYLPWQRGQPNGLSHQRCVEVNFKTFKEDGMFGYNDLNCAIATRCYYCKMPERNKFRLRGLCEKTSMDNVYNLKIDDTQKDRPFWKGYRKTQIVWDDSTQAWKIQKFDNNAVIAVYNSSSNFPVGIRNWTIVNDNCQQDDWQKTLMLSSCTDNEFSCGDGSCVSIHVKCNGVMDCKDDLDEKDCHFIEFPETRRYQNNFPPIILYDGIIQPLEVNITLDVMEISRIEEKGMKFSSKYVVGLTWFEDRLRWRDLSQNIDLNLLSHEEEEKLWLPKVKYGPERGKDGGKDVTVGSVNIRQMTQFSRSTLDRLEEVALYDGKDNAIYFKQELEKDFSCSFLLYRYPFDTQRCKIEIRMPGEVKELVQLIPEKILYSGQKVLLQYKVLDISVTKRDLWHHIANTYLPTFCLWWICQSCLYFKAEHFKTTSGVSITVMLVMYTLYQCVSINLPPTSYLKMIDVWLIFGLCVPFLIFLLLTTIEHSPQSRTKSSLEIFGKFVLPVIIILFAIIYSIIAYILYNSI